MKGLKYNLALLAANLLFALNYSIFVLVLEHESLSLGAIYLLQTFGLLVLAILLRPFGGSVRNPIMGRDIIIIGLTSLLSSFGWSYATLWGMSLSSSLDAATLSSVGPSLTLIFAHLLGRRHITWLRSGGVLLSLMGAAILIFSQWGLLTRGRGAEGNLMLLGAVIIAAVNTLIFKPQIERYGLLRIFLIYALFAFGVSLPLFWGELSSVRLPLDDLGRMSEVALLLLSGSALPLLLLFEGVEHLSPLHTSLYRYVQPFTTALILYSRGDRVFSVSNIVALAIIIIGGVAVAKGVDRAE